MISKAYGPSAVYVPDVRQGAFELGAGNLEVLQVGHNLRDLRQVRSCFGKTRHVVQYMLCHQLFQRLATSQSAQVPEEALQSANLAQEVINIAMVLCNAFEELIKVLHITPNLENRISQAGACILDLLTS